MTTSAQPLEVRSEARPSAPPIRVRAMQFPFRESAIPRHWFYENAHLTQLGNALQLLFPAGERFFIRSVKHYEDQIRDPGLRARIRGFYGQEGRHGHEHDRFNRILEEHREALGARKRVGLQFVGDAVAPAGRDFERRRPRASRGVAEHGIGRHLHGD